MLAGRWARISTLLAVLSLGVGLAGVAGAQTVEESAAAAQISILEARVEEQDALLHTRIDEISTVGAELEETQSRVDDAQARSRELGEQAGRLERELGVQEEAFDAAKAEYEEKARAAYKGGGLEGVTLLLDGILGSSDSPAGLADPRVADILFEDRERIEVYRESQQILQNTSRQISQKKSDYRDAIAEKRARSEELRRHEEELDGSIARIRSDNARTVARLQSLKAAERARILRTRAATGGGEVGRGYELEVAREEIVAEPVEPISKREYVRLYKESARKYGFGEDWYVLAAVGKVESNHGENMGPSSAGALGPMQFLPSTWETSGVDGNGDGVANIMDARDAIPAAAGYLRDGGAPQDWYRALYTYNHADWYVKKVLAVAEGYRRLAGDNTVGPYL
ncbi:MAG: lytic murein transglycosylase [Actinomycetota bacterium]|nr:lytic murein transglycosylase [Actinomycetota bacterium]